LHQLERPDSVLDRRPWGAFLKYRQQENSSISAKSASVLGNKSCSARISCVASSLPRSMISTLWFKKSIE